LGILVKPVGQLKLKRNVLRALGDVLLVPFIASKGLVEFGMHAFEAIYQVPLCRGLRLLEVIFGIIEGLQAVQKHQVVNLT
jgi:hypothetical protein